jgi:hypothetical protein
LHYSRNKRPYPWRKELEGFGSELEFLKSLWGLGAEEEEVYRTGPPGYIGWRNSFLGIDSGDPYTFKNTVSEFSCPDEFRMSESREKKILCLLSRKMDNCCEVLIKVIGNATTKFYS